MELTLGTKIIIGVIFDRDYRSDFEISGILSEIKKNSKLAHIHRRKEIENFLLSVEPIHRAIKRKIEDRKKRTGNGLKFNETVHGILLNITEPLRHSIIAQFISKQVPFHKIVMPSMDESTITENLMKDFEKKWGELEARLFLVPGKKVFALLNNYLQDRYQITITLSQLIDCFELEDIPDELSELIEKIECFRKESID